MRSLTTYPVSSRTPKARMTTAAPTSMPRMASKPNPARLRTKRPAQALAPTASVAMTATVIAVPTPITRVATTPAQNNPCASANTSTRIAPEHGRRPTATIAESPRRQPPGPAHGRAPKRKPRHHDDAHGGDGNAHLRDDARRHDGRARRRDHARAREARAHDGDWRALGHAWA